MAIVSKTNKDGIDFVIDNLQQKMYLNLLSFWQVGATYQCYPRANKNYKRENVIPEISLDEKDYKEVLNDDKFSVTSFFLNNDTRVYQDEWGQIKQSISVIFQADLVQLYGATERYDEQFNMDVLRILKKENKYVVDDIEIVEGVDNVFSDLTLTSRLKDNINRTDISQYHCVKFTFNVLYKYKCGDLPSLASVCPAATYRNSDGTFIQSIVSGGSYTAPDVTITINGSPNILPANKDASYTVPASPAGNTMNGTSLTDIVAGTTKNFTIRYADDSPVTVTTITDNATEFIGEVPNPTAATPTGGIYKSGTTNSYLTGDEANDPPGYGTNFFELGFNNPFGHGFRISGTTGGYTDGSSYFDVNGIATTKALAFPNDIALYWDKYNQSSDNVFAVCFNALATTSLNNHLASQPYTLDSKSDWKVITLDELNVLTKMDTSANGWLDYLPIERPYSITADRIWTRTPAEITNYYHFWTGFFTSRTASTSSYPTYITRLYTLTELGL